VELAVRLEHRITATAVTEPGYEECVITFYSQTRNAYCVLTEVPTADLAPIPLPVDEDGEPCEVTTDDLDALLHKHELDRLDEWTPDVCGFTTIVDYR
jgi:hypothetical protein